jgi:hypothetical protein
VKNSESLLIYSKARRQHPPVEERDYLTLREAAAWIGVSTSTLRAWIRWDRAHPKSGLRKAPAFYRAGKLILFRKRSVEEWIESHTF